MVLFSHSLYVLYSLACCPRIYKRTLNCIYILFFPFNINYFVYSFLKQYTHCLRLDDQSPACGSLSTVLITSFTARTLPLVILHMNKLFENMEPVETISSFSCCLILVSASRNIDNGHALYVLMRFTRWFSCLCLYSVIFLIFQISKNLRKNFSILILNFLFWLNVF